MKGERLEVKRRHGPSLGERLKWHLGTFVAIALAVVFGLVAAGLVGGPPAESHAALADVRATVERVQGAMDRRTFPGAERMAEVEGRIADLGARLRHSGHAVQPAAGITYPAAYLKTLEPGQSNEIRFGAPIDVKATAEAGGIDLAWAEPPGNNVKVGTFEITRKAPGAEPAVVATISGETRTWRDAATEAGKTYEYTVVAIAADADLARTPRGRSPASAPASVRAIADFKIELIACQEGVATLRVSRWHEGSWRDRTYEVPEGGAIGAADPALGIDFSTGRRLSKIAVETEEVSVNKAVIVFDADGRVVVENGAPKRALVSATETKRHFSAEIVGGSLPDETLVLDAN